MFIQSLVENTTTCGLATVHGLAFYLETPKHKMLFDLGPDETLFANAKACQIDLTAVDTVILSHGHYDHGGALEQFLKINHTAKIYCQKSAFSPCFSIHDEKKSYIGIDPNLQNQPQLVLVEGDYQIDEELSLFIVPEDRLCHSPTNDCLYGEHDRDTFPHEQYLFIQGETPILLMGCGHKGVVNILEKAKSFAPKLTIGGFHLYSPSEKKTAPEPILQEIATHLKNYETTFYTCHCTGQEAYQFLKNQGLNIHYLACGDTLTL